MKREVTSERELERRLIRAQRAEAYAQIAACVAHDVNNLLTVIQGHAELLEGLLEPGHAGREETAVMRRASASAATLVRQLAAFRGTEESTPAPAHVDAFIDSLAPMLRGVLGTGITLLLRASAGLAPVLIDAGQLEQVLVNFALNARDAMPRGGTFSLESSCVDARDAPITHAGLPDGRWVRILAADTGDGMPEWTRSRVFEPFFTTKSRGHGTGLGLTSAHGIVRQAGGHLFVDSVPGLGTTFTAYLPPIATVTAGELGERPPKGEETILVIDDDPDARAFAEGALMSFGYRVLTASGLDAPAVTAAEPGGIDLVLCPVVLRAGHGIATVAAHPERRPALRVLYVSNLVGDAPQRAAIPDRDVLVAPFAAPTLARRVRAALDDPTSDRSSGR